jgi:hypothetical protein
MRIDLDDEEIDMLIDFQEQMARDAESMRKPRTDASVRRICAV